MDKPSRSLLSCSQCGSRLPPGASFCPHDGARGLEDTSIGVAATLHRSPSAPRLDTGERASDSIALPRTHASAGSAAVEGEGAWEATVARDVLVGKQLGDFVVKRRIGAGGMGIVYEGEHPIIGRKVAIKILRPEFLEGAQARDLVAEARAASAIRHRGIIDIFGFGTIPGIGQYLVMEFLEGAPLDEVIGRRGPMRESEVIALLDELLSALSAAHAMGVIHRDLKPGNIFVVKDSSGAESVKVLDFGLAKRSEVPHGSTPQTRASLIVGTPEFMAPEQASGQAVSPATDLYAVGVIAFQMLTRRLPFVGDSAISVAIQQMQATPPAPSEFVYIHPALNALVLRLLAKKPSERPSSAEETRRELKAILGQLGEDTARPGGAGELPPSARPSSRGGSGVSRSTASLDSGVSSATVVRGARAGSGRASVRESREAEPAVAPLALSEAPAPARSPTVRTRRLGPLLGAVVGLAALGGLGVLALMRQAPPAVVATSPVGTAPPEARAPAADKPAPLAVEAPPAAVPAQPPEAAPPESPAPVAAQAVEKTPESTARSAPQEARLPGSRSAQSGPRRMGTLRLVVRGWGHIYVDGEAKGKVPPTNELELPAGRHELMLVNPARNPYRATVRIKAGQTLEHRVTFAEEP